jgi:ubiquinone/menaquinone biosynthesis C-methylase UbiE
MTDRRRSSTGWQLDRRAPEAYERYLVPAVLETWVDPLLDRAGVSEGDRVLDLACGTGVVARRVAARVGDTGSVVGFDVNEGMLAVAEETAAGVQPAIEWRQGDATDLPFPDGSFDIVCCQQALQFFDDRPTALGEARRVLAPDGRLAASVWRPLEYQPGYVVLAEALERHVGEEAGGMMRSPFPAWDGEDLRTLARDAGFDEVTLTIEVDSGRYPSAEEFVRREAASSPLAEPIGAVGPRARDELIRDVASGIEAYTDDEGVVLPMETHVLVAR